MNPFATITNDNVTQVVDFRSLSAMLTFQYIREFRLAHFGDKYISSWKARLGMALLALSSFCISWLVSTLALSNDAYESTHVTLICLSAVTAVVSVGFAIFFYRETNCTLARLQAAIEDRLIEDRLLLEFPNAVIRRHSGLGVREERRLDSWMSMKMIDIHVLDKS